MSVILDALQKVSTSTPPPNVSFPAPRRPSWNKIAAAIAVFVVAGVVLSRPQKPAERETAHEPTWVPTAPSSSNASLRREGLQLLRNAESQWRLSGIVHGGEGKPLALINGQIVEEGGSLRGAKIARITEHEVELEQEGATKTLRLE